VQAYLAALEENAERRICEQPHLLSKEGAQGKASLRLRGEHEGELMPDCDLCNSEMADARYNTILGVNLCSHCLTRVEEHHQVDGKFVVKRCPTCYKLERIDWIPYKKRGAKPGTKHAPRKPKNIKSLEEFA
jgi:hypothetical protein